MLKFRTSHVIIERILKESFLKLDDTVTACGRVREKEDWEHLQLTKQIGLTMVYSAGKGMLMVIDSATHTSSLLSLGLDTVSLLLT